jgi:hypothetical protein
LSKPRRASTLLRSSLALIALLAASLSGGVFTPGGFSAGTASASALYAVPTTSVMVPAGGSAQLQVRGMSLQPGSTISPAPASLAAQPVPPDNVRTALYYGINWGYTETDPEQAVLAVWYAQDGTWHGDKHSTAEQIQSAAAASPGTPSWSPSGRSALQLVGSGQVGLGDITLTPSQLSPSVGSGTLTLTNTSDQELLVYLPYGTIFGTGPASVLVWAVGEVEQAALPSATPEEVLPQATDTVEVIESTPTATATVNNAPPPSKKVAATATPPTEAAQEASPTQQVPVAKKSAATSTLTPAPTDTPLPTDTATQEPTATSTPTVPPTTAPAQPKNSAASQNAAPDQAANADVAAPEGSKAQSQASNDAADAAPAGNNGTSNDQNNAQVQPPADAGTTSADAQVPAAKKGAGTTSVQEIGADQGGKTEALAPVVTITTIPRPVETTSGSAGNSAAVPPAIQTSGATPPPPPVQTSNPTVPAGSTGVPTRPTSARTGTPSPTRAATNSPTPASTADIPLRQTPQPVESAESVPSTQPGGEKTPIPVEPTQEAAPEPTRLTDLPTATAPVPVIVTDPGGGTTDGGQGGVTVGSDSADGGTSPSVNPRTGGGPSPLPLLLSVSSVILVLSGWQLRRVAARHSANR